MTWSPTTSTSGRRKCLSATIAAKHAQSSIFPESAKKCRVSRKFHTYRLQSYEQRGADERLPYPLSGLYAQRLLVNDVAPPDYFVQHASDRHFLLRGTIIAECHQL
jgi:hypothetical protein